MKFVHTNVRVRDIDASLRFYGSPDVPVGPVKAQSPWEWRAEVGE